MLKKYIWNGDTSRTLKLFENAMKGNPKLTCENMNGDFESPINEAHTTEIFVHIDLDN